MDYGIADNIIRNTPFDNPFTKVACGLGILWVGFIGVRYATRDDQSPSHRKGRQNFTSSKIDKALDHRNKAFGKRVPSNPSVPFYSRHNYNRRRRSKAFW